MNTQSLKFKIRLGLFVAAGITIFLISVFLIGKQKNLFNPVFQVKTTFYSVSGLQVGNNVRFLGINIGTVDNINIVSDSTVEVNMIIQKNIQPFIKQDCIVSIGSEGIIGDRLLVISQGSSQSPSVKGGESLSSVKAVEIDNIIASLQVSALYAEIISEQLAEIMININQGHGVLGALINDTNIAKNINSTILNLQSSSRNLDDNMEALKSNFLFKSYYKKERKEEEDEKTKLKIKIKNE